MKTKIKKRGDTIVVTLGGHLDFETHVPFRENLSKLIEPNSKSPKKIIFNLEDLEFVGSSGISAFVQALRDFNANSETPPKYCNVKSEFQQIIQAFDQNEQFEFFDNEARAEKSFDH